MKDAFRLFRHKMFELNLLPRFDLTRHEIHGRRHYLVESGIYYPSVTTLLGAYFNKDLSIWRNRIGAEAADAITHRAGVRGTRLHNLCEKYLLNEPIDFRKEMPSAIADFNSAKEVLDQNVRSVYGVEFPLYSRSLMTAGTTDVICNWNGVTSIVDFKTARKAKKEEWIEDYFVQSAIYGKMANEHFDIDVKQFVIILFVQHERPVIIQKPLSEYVEKVNEVCIFKRPVGFLCHHVSNNDNLDCTTF
jgi:hypothetical protein